jgi:hypothetical protein
MGAGSVAMMKTPSPSTLLARALLLVVELAPPLSPPALALGAYQDSAGPPH